MTDHKAEATYHGDDLPQRTPLDTFASYGAPPEKPIGHATGETGERPYVNSGTPPWGSLSQDIGHPAPSPSWRDNLAAVNPSVKYPVIGALVITLITLLALVVQRSNVLPAGVPLVGKDSGLAACEILAKGNGPTGSGKVEPSDWKTVRAVFADSRYPAIRDNGIKVADLGAQIEALGSDPGLGALAYISSFTDAYAGLAGGCAAVGHPIPALTSLGK